MPTLTLRNSHRLRQPITSNTNQLQVKLTLVAPGEDDVTAEVSLIDQFWVTKGVLYDTVATIADHQAEAAVSRERDGRKISDRALATRIDEVAIPSVSGWFSTTLAGDNDLTLTDAGHLQGTFPANSSIVDASNNRIELLNVSYDTDDHRLLFRFEEAAINLLNREVIVRYGSTTTEVTIAAANVEGGNALVVPVPGNVTPAAGVLSVVLLEGASGSKIHVLNAVPTTATLLSTAQAGDIGIVTSGASNGNLYSVTSVTSSAVTWALQGSLAGPAGDASVLSLQENTWDVIRQVSTGAHFAAYPDDTSGGDAGGIITYPVTIETNADNALGATSVRTGGGSNLTLPAGIYRIEYRGDVVNQSTTLPQDDFNNRLLPQADIIVGSKRYAGPSTYGRTGAGSNPDCTWSRYTTTSKLCGV